MNELTQEQKQAIWAAGWLIQNTGDIVQRKRKGWDTSGTIEYLSDAQLIAYAQEKGMDLPPELVGPVAELVEALRRIEAEIKKVTEDVKRDSYLIEIARDALKKYEATK